MLLIDVDRLITIKQALILEAPHYILKSRG